MKYHRYRDAAVLCALLLCLACATSCHSPNAQIEGTVTVDGTPLDEGTIHFQSSSDTSARGVGTAVRDGKFRLPENGGLPPGQYNVSVNGFKKTGRMVTDPQRGSVAEIVPLKFQNSPQQVEVSNDNSVIQIELKSSA